MKLKFTRKTWYFFLLAAAAVSMLGGFAVLGGMDFSALELVAFCLTGIAALFLAAQKGAPAREKRNYTGVFVVLMLSKLAAGGWAGDICSALVWPALLATEYERGRPIQRQPVGERRRGAAHGVLAAHPLCGHGRACLLDEPAVRAAGLCPRLGGADPV